MRVPHVQIEWNGFRIPSVTPEYVIKVTPEPGAPKGRKARLMADYWAGDRTHGAAGVLWQDPDIVMDPGDMEEMLKVIEMADGCVWTAKLKLWPASTARDEWVWGSGICKHELPVMSQHVEYYPQWFSMGFTYTPAKLLDIAAPHMPQWEYGMCDMGLSRLAREHSIPIRLASRCQPKHLHFYPVQGDWGWAG